MYISGQQMKQIEDCLLETLDPYLFNPVQSRDINYTF